MLEEFRSKNFICLLLSSTLNSFAFYSLVPTLPLYFYENLKMSFKEIGIVISSFSVSVIFFRPFAGYIVDAVRRQTLLKSVLLFFTLLYGAYLTVKSFEGLVVLRVCHGALFGISSSAFSAAVADLSSPLRIGRSISLYSVTIPLGMVIGSFFGLKILKLFGPQTMFIFAVLFSFASFALSIKLEIQSFPSERKTDFALQGLFSKEALPFSFSMFFPMVIYGSINTFVAIFAKEAHFHSPEIFFLLFSLSLLFGRLLTGKFFDRGELKLLIFLGLFFVFFGTLILGFAKNEYIFLLSGVVSGSGFGILMPTCQAAINLIAEPKNRGSANSTYFLSYDLGIGVSSFVLGYLLEKTTLADMYRFLSVLPLFSAFVFFRISIPEYEKKITF